MDTLPKALIDEQRLADRIAELGRQIREDVGPDDTLVCVGVLKGSFMFLADLVREIGGPVWVDFLGVSSYAGTESTGEVRITHDVRERLEGQHVLVVEDIVDTGLTLDYIVRMFETRHPASLRVAALLDKPSRRKIGVPVDYVGFEIPDAFVIGYGLDYDELWRNLPYIGVLEG